MNEPMIPAAPDLCEECWSLIEPGTPRWLGGIVMRHKITGDVQLFTLRLHPECIEPYAAARPKLAKAIAERQALDGQK